jgi:hypothetical protein
MSEDPLSAITIDFTQDSLNISDFEPAADSAITWQILLETCNATEIAEWHLFSTYSKWIKCMEVGKILVDKRLKTLQTIKCNVTDQEALTCRSRPN